MTQASATHVEGVLSTTLVDDTAEAMQINVEDSSGG